MNLEIFIGETLAVDAPVQSVPPESLLMPMEFTTAAHAHLCGYNSRHWLDAGMVRLTVRGNNDEHHYCLECANTLLSRGADQLQIFLAGLSELSEA
jgi:hypothetical protein